MAKGGMNGKRGGAWYAPPQDTASHCAGGTHPTGMHSCYLLQTKLREGNVFALVCDCVHREVGVSVQGGCLSPRGVSVCGSLSG